MRHRRPDPRGPSAGRDKPSTPKHVTSRESNGSPRCPAHPPTTPPPRDRLVDHLPAWRAMLEHTNVNFLEQVAELDAVVEDTAPTTAGDRARHALADINGALALVATGGYDRCCDCHTDIPMRLLRPFPHHENACTAGLQHRTPADGQTAAHTSPQSTHLKRWLIRLKTPVRTTTAKHSLLYRGTT